MHFDTIFLRYQGQELPVGCRTSVTFRRLRRPGLTDSDAIWAPASAEKRCSLLNIGGRSDLRITDAILGAPCYNYSIMGPKKKEKTLV